MIDGQMGKLETRNQTEAALELAKRAYIDGSRIGVFGWSYGGYMASNLLFQSPDVFKMAVRSDIDSTSCAFNSDKLRSLSL